MSLAAILATLLLAGPMYSGREAAHRFSGSGLAHAASPQEENSQPPAARPPKAAVGETKKEEEPPGKKAAEPGSQNSPHTSTARKRRPRTKKTTTASADGEPRKIVIHRGGATEPVTQILPGISQEEADRQRQSAEQLLVAAESGLQALAVRTLNTDQQDTVVQVRHYLDVARSALKESDTQRAHTLALKAYLLSDDLVKHP